MNRVFLAMAGAAMLTCLPAPACGGEPIDRTVNMPPDGRVRVENLAGRIEFETWDEPRVQIRGEAGDDVEEVEINATSRGVEVRVRNREGVRRIDGTELLLKVPVGASLEAESVSADIEVAGSRGESLILNSVSGDIDVQAAPGRVEMNSVSGDIELEGEVVRTSVESVSGDIALRGLRGELRISTVSGDVGLDAGPVELARFESVSGDLALLLSLADGGRLTCESMSGNVELRLPASQTGRFDARTFSGSIRSDFGRSKGERSGPGIVLEHVEGEGGAEIRLESFSGDIEIRSE